MEEDKATAEAEVKDQETFEMTEDRLLEMITEASEAGAKKALAELPAKKATKNITVEKDESEQPFLTPGDFFMAVKNAAITKEEDVRLKLLKGEDGYQVKSYKAQPTGLGEEQPEEGGFLVGEDRAASFHERMYADGVLLNAVEWVDISANSNGLIMNALDETSRVDGSRWGGVRGYWVAEAASITASQPAFRQMNLRLKKVAALCYATDELLADSAALGSWLMRVGPAELRFKVEDSFINGDASGKPKGIIDDSNIYVSVTAEGGQAATTVVAENIDKMYSRMWAGSLGRAQWYINQDVYPELFGLERSVGTGGSAAFMPPGGLSAAPYGTLLGKPINPIEYCQTLGTLGDIIFADFSQYQAIRKGGVQSASSIHVQFLTDQTVYRFIYRVDGQPIWNSSLTPFKGSNTVSPFVVLATRS